MKGSLVMTSVLAKMGLIEGSPDGTMARINEVFKDIDWPDEAVSSAMSNILTRDEAKRDPQLFQYYNQFIEDDFNKALEADAKQLKIDEQTILEIKSAPMNKRAGILAGKTQASDPKYLMVLKEIEKLHADRNAPRQQFDDKLQQKIEEAKNSFDANAGPDRREEVEVARKDLLSSWKR